MALVEIKNLTKPYVIPGLWMASALIAGLTHRIQVCIIIEGASA